MLLKRQKATKYRLYPILAKELTSKSFVPALQVNTGIGYHKIQRLKSALVAVVLVCEMKPIPIRLFLSTMLYYPLILKVANPEEILAKVFKFY